MGLRDNRTLLVRFEHASDMVMALSRDQTSIGDDTFKVFRWAHCMNGDFDAAITPVWIALPQLQDRCWFPKFFVEAGNSIGTFLRVDHPTAAMARPSVARMCVEIDLSKELPKRIGVKVKGVMEWQKIVYQNMPSYCSNCRMQGHSTIKCRRFRPAPSSPAIPLNIHQTHTPNTHGQNPSSSQAQAPSQNLSHTQTATHTNFPQPNSKNQHTTSTNYPNYTNTNQKNQNDLAWQQVERGRKKKRPATVGVVPSSSNNNSFQVLYPVVEETATEVEELNDSEVDEEIEAEEAPVRARAEEFEIPPVRAEIVEEPSNSNSDFTPSIVQGCDAAVRDHMAATKPPVVVEETSVSSGMAQMCSDIAAATRVIWTEDQSTLMNAHNVMISDAQRSGTAVEDVSIASNNDCVDIDMELEGTRVATDSEGNTLVRETPVDSSLSSLLGTAPPEFDDDHQSVEESDGDPESGNSLSDCDARLETEGNPNATTSSDPEDREPSSPKATMTSKPKCDRGDRSYVTKPDSDAEKRLTRSSKLMAGRSVSNSSNA